MDNVLVSDQKYIKLGCDQVFITKLVHGKIIKNRESIKTSRKQRQKSIASMHLKGDRLFLLLRAGRSDPPNHCLTDGSFE